MSVRTTIGAANFVAETPEQTIELVNDFLSMYSLSLFGSDEKIVLNFSIGTDENGTKAIIFSELKLEESK